MSFPDVDFNLETQKVTTSPLERKYINVADVFVRRQARSAVASGISHAWYIASAVKKVLGDING
jgi:hypothetical protein